jgi:hypothetical protein
VRDFFEYGINGTTSDGCIIEDVRAINNGLYGIRVRHYSRIKDCLAIGNLQNDGISVSAKSVISGCVAANNGNGVSDAGIRVGSDSGTVIGSTSSDNNGFGIRVGSGSTISTCTARNNTSNGLDASSTGMVHGSTATGNAINISATATHDSHGP